MGREGLWRGTWMPRPQMLEAATSVCWHVSVNSFLCQDIDDINGYKELIIITLGYQPNLASNEPEIIGMLCPCSLILKSSTFSYVHF